jgi:hypothetical protein
MFRPRTPATHPVWPEEAGVSRHEQRPQATAEVSKYLGVGLTWALSTIVFLFLGRAADRWLGTDPALTVVGAFVGAAAGFYSMIHHLVIEPRRRDAERRAKGEHDDGSS